MSTVVDVPPNLPAGLTDSHCHLESLAERGVDIAAYLAAFRAAGGGTVVNVAISPADHAVRLARAAGDPQCPTTAGLHPVATANADHGVVATLERQVADGGIVAIGETGLDWHRMYAPRDRQLDLFRAQLAIARSARLPVIIHNRDADADVLAELRRARLPRGGIMHCYSSSADLVAAFVDLGFSISFAGNVTYPRADALRSAAAVVPADRLLIETDAPYLAPQGHRGATNHPALLVHTAQGIADVRGERLETIVARTAENARRLFSLPPAG